MKIGGSSPRMRGKPCCRGRGLSARRLIPAHAGKTLADASPPPPSGAHPRACGENLSTPMPEDSFPGSSPRMRGKQAAWNATNFARGLIPAHAGKTCGRHRRRRVRRAHPRACGENVTAPIMKLTTNGSSPRMRGKQRTRVNLLQVHRLIPAHAGKTPPLAMYSNTLRAHPRACGENDAANASQSGAAGSSPRMRGKLRHSSATSVLSGLIPAHAGKTGQQGTRALWARAHPRACGEN